MIEQETLHPIVRSLFSHDVQEVQSAMDSLMRAREGSRQEEELLEIVRQYKSAEGSAPLWAMIILGKIHSRVAIPLLLNVLDSGWDYWMEAAMEALEDIAPMHPNDMLNSVPEFIQKRWDHDPESARLFAYNAIAALAPDEQAKRFLIYAFEHDDTWADSIAHDLARFADRAVLELFKPNIEYAHRLGDQRSELEWREAYCELDGDPFGHRALYEQGDLRKQPWKERWKFQFEELDKEDVEEEDADDTTAALKHIDALEDDPEMKKIIEKNQKENEQLEQYPIAPFDLAAYLGIRVRGAAEEAMDEALRLTGLDEQWSVEKIQKLFDASQKPQEAFQLIAGETNPFASRGALEEFFRRFFDLWNKTPRTEFGGLTPEAIMEIRALSQRKDVGRNDPCPCGAQKEDGTPMKYKRCHGV